MKRKRWRKLDAKVAKAAAAYLECEAFGFSEHVHKRKKSNGYIHDLEAAKSADGAQQGA